jgi:hypothetical protein
MGMIGNTPYNGLIGSGNIQDGAVTNDKMAAGLDAAKLTLGTLPVARIPTGSLSQEKLSTGAPAWDASGNTVISGALSSGSGVAARRDFYSYSNNADSGSLYVHLKTNRSPVSESMMYAVKFEGYSYGQAIPVDANLVWYNYAPNSNVISVGTSGTHSCGAYKSADGFAVMTLYVPTLYFLAFNLSQIRAAQGMAAIQITAVTVSASSSGVY